MLSISAQPNASAWNLNSCPENDNGSRSMVGLVRNVFVTNVESVCVVAAVNVMPYRLAPINVLLSKVIMPAMMSPPMLNTQP